MKIALLFHTLVAKGGSQRLFLSLGHALRRIGHDVYVYTYFFNDKEIEKNLIGDLDLHSVVKVSDSSRFLSISFSGRIALAKDYFMTSSKWAQSILNLGFDIINPHEAIAYKSASEMNGYSYKILDSPIISYNENVCK